MKGGGVWWLSMVSGDYVKAHELAVICSCLLQYRAAHAVCQSRFADIAHVHLSCVEGRSCNTKTSIGPPRVCKDIANCKASLTTLTTFHIFGRPSTAVMWQNWNRRNAEFAMGWGGGGVPWPAPRPGARIAWPSSPPPDPAL